MWPLAEIDFKSLQHVKHYIGKLDKEEDTLVLTVCCNFSETTRTHCSSSSFLPVENVEKGFSRFFGSVEPTVEEMRLCVSILKPKENKKSGSSSPRPLTSGSGPLCRVRKLKDTLVAVQQLEKKMSNMRTWLSSVESELAKPVVYSVCHSDEIKKQLEEQQVGSFLRSPDQLAI